MIIDGQSILGDITPAVTPQNSRGYHFAESIDGTTDQWTISNGTTKYIFDTDTGNRGTSGCYDLVTDPGELDPNSGNPAICNMLENSSPRNQ